MYKYADNVNNSKERHVFPEILYAEALYTRYNIRVCNIKYKLKQISAGRTKCYNIVRMAAKAAAFQLRRSASRMQPVGCATFRNSCGHFEHAGFSQEC